MRCLEQTCPNGCMQGQCAALGVSRWTAVKRLTVPPTFSEYIKEFAFPRVPFIIERNCASLWGWPLSDDRWTSPEYFLKHPQVCARSSAEVRTVSFRNGRVISRNSATILHALSDICNPNQREFRDDKLYLCSWEYDPPTDEMEEDTPEYDGPCLSDDVGCGVPFASCVFGASSHEGFRALSQMMRWIFIGEAETGTATHVDPIASHAWMWLASGEKAWRILIPPKHRKIMLEKPDFPDLFNCSSIAELGAGELIFTSLQAGELLFLPAGVIHSVQNTSATVALTHNFVDVASLSDMLALIFNALELCIHALVVGSTIESVLQSFEEEHGSLLCGILAITIADPDSFKKMLLQGLRTLSFVPDPLDKWSQDALSLLVACERQVVEILNLLNCNS